MVYVTLTLTLPQRQAALFWAEPTRSSRWGREIGLIEGGALYQALTPRPSDN